MQGNKPLTMQRTVIVTCGKAADQAGQALLDLFEERDTPTEAIAILRGHDDLPEAEIESELRQVSQMNSQARLARQGWSLDRLDEVAVFLLVDLNDPSSLHLAAELVGRLGRAAEQRLGLSAGGLLLALAPNLEDPESASQLAGLTANRQRWFSRGVFGLSLVNQNGLCLGGQADLIEQCARILYLLIASPLRDAPEWLTDLNGESEGSGERIGSLGLSTWQWVPSTVREWLATRWAVSALAAWRRPEPGNESAPASHQAQKWLDDRGFEAGSLQQLVGRHLLPQPEFLPWRYPLPWRLHRHFRRLKQPVSAEPQSGATGPGEQRPLAGHDGTPEHIGPGNRHPDEEQAREILARTLEKTGEALFASACQMLDEQPVAGLAWVLAFGRALAAGLEDMEDGLAGQREIRRARLAAMTARQRATAERMASLLADWPQPRLGAWLWAALRPWHWLGLARRYWQIEKTGRTLVWQAAEIQSWQREERVSAAVSHACLSFGERVRQLALQVEEIDDMLASLQRKIDGGPAKGALEPAADADVVEVLYWHLVEGPDLEAERAAEAIGGLGRQVLELDDAILEGLLAAGWQRFADLVSLTAVDVLALLYPVPGELEAWWERAWEAAAPMWRYDEAQVPEAVRAQGSTLTLVYGGGVARLSERLGLPATPERRWLPATVPEADWEQLAVLRLQGDVPVLSSAGGTENRFGTARKGHSR
jgi:hypothetical protein